MDRKTKTGFSEAPDLTVVQTDATDGRHRRTQRSREKIIAAMFRLISDDDPYPSVVAIANEAGVSKRTAFRLFSDLDSLIMEMSQQLKDELRPVIYAPYESNTWRGKLGELVDRRAIVFEKIMILKQSADIRRFRSKFLMSDYTNFVEREKATLLELLPTRIKRSKSVTAALMAALSFQTWTQLRLQQGLSPRQARAAMHTAMEAMVDGF
ncbi:MAG: TetR/AcrR family transcriptional regulator [Pseudomonadota bacterium]